MTDETIKIILSFAVVLIPVLGITIRLALKPVADSIVKVMQARQTGEEIALMERRMALLEQEMHLMRGEMGSLSEQKEFYGRLVESAPLQRLDA